MVVKATTTVLRMTGINTVIFFFNVKFSLNNKHLNNFQFCTKMVSVDVCSQSVYKQGRKLQDPVLPAERRDSVSLRVTTRGECGLHSLRWLRLCSSFHLLRAGRGTVTHCRVGLRYSAPRSFSQEETIALMEISPKGVHASPLRAQLILERS